MFLNSYVAVHGKIKQLFFDLSELTNKYKYNLKDF